METDDEDDPNLSQSIGNAFGGVHIAVIDPSGDAPETAAAETGSTAVWKSLKDLWVELKEHGGNEDAGQKLVMDWYTTMTKTKTNGPLRSKPTLRTTPYGPNARLPAAASPGADNDQARTDVAAFVGIAG